MRVYEGGFNVMKEAALYRRRDGLVDCFLCSHRCSGIREGGKGLCGVRQNIGGVFYSLVYGKVVAANVDPVEKKPFYNYLPGSMAYSIATVGCNFRCRNCQNADISQAPRTRNYIEGVEMKPEEVVCEAESLGCSSIAYTYTEPTIFFEYAYDISKIAKTKDVHNLFVTNGYMSPEMLDMYHPLLDAANVDLKSFRDEFYREVCGARLDPVLDSLRRMKKLGVWVEVTTLVIPEMNDSAEELRDIACFIRDELGRETPWHISRFHPDYELMDVPPTSPEIIHEARRIGLDEGLFYVYSGNLPGDAGENTYCPNCGMMLIRRVGFTVLENKLKESKCPECSEKIHGVFS